MYFVMSPSSGFHAPIMDYLSFPPAANIMPFSENWRVFIVTGMVISDWKALLVVL
jgi:hypothetical protein